MTNGIVCWECFCKKERGSIHHRLAGCEPTTRIEEDAKGKEKEALEKARAAGAETQPLYNEGAMVKY